MDLHTKKEFKKLKLGDRYNALRKDGDYIGGLLTNSHRRYLYSYNGFFVELWVLVSFNQIQWIEVQENQSILNEYVKDINVKNYFDI